MKYIGKLTWRDVMDGSKLSAGTHISEATHNARSANYPYLAWNGLVYEVLSGDVVTVEVEMTTAMLSETRKD
jgi:hypothetical protein